MTVIAVRTAICYCDHDQHRPATVPEAYLHTTEARDIYARLGVKTVINGQGTCTNVGGSLMPPEAVRAMVEAARLVRLDPGVFENGAA